MTAIDLLTNPHMREVQGIPPSRIGNPKMLDHDFRGVLWVDSPAILRDLTEAGHRVIPNTTRIALMKGDYAGVFLDDGYWLVCDAACKDM